MIKITIIKIIIIITAPCIVDSMKNKINKNLLFEKTERKTRLMDTADTFSNITPRDDLNTPSMRCVRGISSA